ncbi:MAG: hypothetical protein AAF927_12095 [Bacteroidota bacterium]
MKETIQNKIWVKVASKQKSLGGWTIYPNRLSLTDIIILREDSIQFIEVSWEYNHKTSYALNADTIALPEKETIINILEYTEDYLKLRNGEDEFEYAGREITHEELNQDSATNDLTALTAQLVGRVWTEELEIPQDTTEVSSYNSIESLLFYNELITPLPKEFAYKSMLRICHQPILGTKVWLPDNGITGWRLYTVHDYIILHQFVQETGRKNYFFEWISESKFSLIDRESKIFKTAK